MLCGLLTNMQLLRGCQNFVEIADDGVALNFRDTDDFSDETWVKENRLPTSHRVCANERVFGHNGIPAYRAAGSTGSIGLHLRRMQSRQSFQVLLHRHGEGVIDSIL